MDKPFGFNRPLDDPNTMRVLKEIYDLIRENDLAGFVMLINPNEAGYTYNLPASWNAIYDEPRSDFGIRIRAKRGVPGDDEKLRLAAHVFVNMIRSGRMWSHFGESFVNIMRERGMEVEYEEERLPNIEAE